MKKHLIFTVKITLTTIALYLLISWVGWEKIRDHLLTVKSPQTLLLALSLAIIFNVIKITKWYSMVRLTGASIEIKDAAKSYLIGMAGGLFTPGRIGEVSRMFSLPDLNKSYIIALTLLDRLLDVLVVVALALPGLARFTPPVVFWLFLASCTIAAFILFLPVSIPALLLARIRKFVTSPKLIDRLTTWEKAVAGLSRQGILIWLSLSLLGYGIVLFEFYWLLWALFPCSAESVLLSQPLIMLTNILPLTIAGVGVREGTAAVLLGTFGIPPAASISAAFQLFLFNTALPGTVGALWLILKQRKKK